MRPSTRMVVLGRRFDTDAQDYIARVEAADGMALEEGVKIAINNFVVGCKTDGIWNAIKASCILAGARTLNGALVPLVGTAPTNFNFVVGDYNRKTGLVGDASTKYLNSNRTGNADPLNSHHIAAYVSSILTTGILMGTDTANNRNTIYYATDQKVFALALRHSTQNIQYNISNVTGLVAASRTSANNVNWRIQGSSGSYSATSIADTYSNIFVFARNNNGLTDQIINARLAFYSIGEALNLALLDARVTTLINVYNTVIA